MATIDSLRITQVANDDDVKGILALHQANLRTRISPEEAQAEGFCTAEYDLSFLKKMKGSIIAKTVDGEVVGYVLCVTRELFGLHPLLDSLFEEIDKIVRVNYCVCGQLCVAKGYRGQGLAGKLYAAFRSTLEVRYDACCTDVASDNPRSLRAHEKVGFETISSVFHDRVRFDIVKWDWRHR